MRLHKTGHVIADTVSDLIGDLPDGDYKAGYGILRTNVYADKNAKWFEIDRGFYGASHFDGNYRLSYRGTQPRYHDKGPMKAHGLDLAPWRDIDGYTLICPPTAYVCDFFKIDYAEWLTRAVRQCKHYKIRNKGNTESLDNVSQVLTLNSSVGIKALQLGIPVISDPIHSTIGSYTSLINSIDKYNRDDLFCFISAHQFKLDDKKSLWNLIKYYLCL